MGLIAWPQKNRLRLVEFRVNKQGQSFLNVVKKKSNRETTLLITSTAKGLTLCMDVSIVYLSESRQKVLENHSMFWLYITKQNESILFFIHFFNPHLSAFQWVFGYAHSLLTSAYWALYLRSCYCGPVDGSLRFCIDGSYLSESRYRALCLCDWF